jgi:ribosomal protein L11 methyltransferase
VVDPGRAFGTGAHPTTRACVELLSRLRRGSLLDAGCGSGVLAVAAARLGFGPVFAIDNDEVAVEVTKRTAQVNGVRVAASRADVLADELPRVDVVVANIDLRAVEALLARHPAVTAVTSGYLAVDAPSADGWAGVDRLELDGWAADVFVAT